MASIRKTVTEKVRIYCTRQSLGELCDDTLGEVNSPLYRKAFHELVEDGEIIVRKGVEWPGDLPPEVYVLKGCCAETVTSFTPYTDYTGDEPKEFEFDEDDN